MLSPATLTHSNTMLGWDVGGAHLKAALISEQGELLEVLQVACPLWRGMDELALAGQAIFSQLEHRLHASPQKHAVTMTGELVDIFANRRAGVMQIAQFMREHLSGEVLFYAAKQGFVDFSQVALYADAIASANWHASASWVAKAIEQGILLDIGSTTSDLIVLKNAEVSAQGLTDADRMRHDELIYAGVVRTPVMALAQKVEFEGGLVNIAAEHFATTADIYRLTGELAAQDDMAETADGQGKTEIESARRLARMVGHDVEYADIETWRALAFKFRGLQLERLQSALLRLADMPQQAPIIGAGVGRFLARALAERLARPYVDIDALFKASATNHWAGVCLPAVAVAKLRMDATC